MSIIDDIKFGRAGAPQYVALLVAATGGRVTANINAIAAACAARFPAYGMNTAARVADFIAQTCNETGGYTVFEENLKYSVKAIRACWPNRFPTDAAAAPFAWNSADADREDMALAAKVYGQRMGNQPKGADNDNEEDGWQYRGRGMLELTGKGNYALYGPAVGYDLVAHPELAADPGVSTLIALEFYRRNGVLKALDAGNTTRARELTNGGHIGLDHVNEIRARVLKALAA